MKCPHCDTGKLETVKANEPYTSEHLMCNVCHSTYPNEAKDVVKNIPTAETFIDMHPSINTWYDEYAKESVVERSSFEKALVEFAQMHVRAAIKEQIRVEYRPINDKYLNELTEKTLKIVYPLTNIV